MGPLPSPPMHRTAITAAHKDLDNIRARKAALKEQQRSLRAEKQARLRALYQQQVGEAATPFLAKTPPMQEIDIQQLTGMFEQLKTVFPEDIRTIDTAISAFIRNLQAPKPACSRSRFFSFSEKYSLKDDRVQQLWNVTRSMTPGDLPKVEHEKQQFICAYEQLIEDICSSIAKTDPTQTAKACELFLQTVTPTIKAILNN